MQESINLLGNARGAEMRGSCVIAFCERSLSSVIRWNIEDDRKLINFFRLNFY